ncbi:MAG: DUF1501 domain-containing protein [Zavarzinella sp.]
MSITHRLPKIPRRDFMRLAGCLGLPMAGWLPAFSEEVAKNPKRKRSCILLWMNGGPSTIDLFDLKKHENGGPVKPIATTAPGLEISEYLPLLAKQMKHLSVVRSMSTKEGDHARATNYTRTGYLPQGSIQFPSVGSLVARELADTKFELPSYVSITPFRGFSPAAFGPGFLGPRFAPLIVGENQFFAQNVATEQLDAALKVKDLDRPETVTQVEALARLDILKDLDEQFQTDHPSFVGKSHQAAYERAVRLMESVGSKVFDLSKEKAEVLDRYGDNLFGRGCLLARKLVEQGVPFVEVSMTGWDTHAQNFNQVKQRCDTLDPAWAALMADIQERGLLETTTIVWMGEFGRTPKINQGTGRDHYPNAWSAVLGGGGIKGGQAIGKTSADGTTVESEPTSVPDFLATLCQAMGIDPGKQNLSNVERPIRIVDRVGKPIQALLS